MLLQIVLGTKSAGKIFGLGWSIKSQYLVFDPILSILNSKLAPIGVVFKLYFQNFIGQIILNFGRIILKISPQSTKDYRRMGY